MGSTVRPSESEVPIDFALVQGQLTAYRLAGPVAPSPTVLLLHGLGAAGRTFAPVGSLLARDFRVVIPDLLGSGRTAKPLIDYRPDEVAAHLDGLLRALAIQGLTAIVGHSQGAAVAVELCRLRSRHVATPVERLVLIDPPPPQGARWLRSITSLPLGARSAEIVSALLPHRSVARAWLSFLYADRSRVTEEVLEAYTEASAGRGYAAATARAIHSLARLDLPLEQAPPTLLLWGAQDRLFPPSLAAAWRARLPSSSLTVLPAAGHCPHEEQPEAVAFSIQQFLALGPLKQTA